MWSGKERQEGMLTVEAVLSLVPFILVILGIISFINIFAVHNKIQYALYQMSNELSCYTYFYQACSVGALWSCSPSPLFPGSAVPGKSGWFERSRKNEANPGIPS